MKNFLTYSRIIHIISICLFVACSSSDDEIVRYELTASSNLSEGGRITPANGTFDSGESVVLTAIPSEGYVFEKWGGGASGDTNPLTVSMNSDLQITASFIKADTDNDGVNDDVDQCPDTASGATVNASGCAETTDEAGGSVDGEDDTDTDGDGVADTEDNCADTPQGEQVDATGCSESQSGSNGTGGGIDGEGDTDTDGDGVTDANDNCADTPQGEQVDATGCSDSQKDADGDGVSDDVDTCDDTPQGEEVDATGCSDSQKDTDEDGVTDDLDTCPNTPTGETPDANGCSDSQKDTDGDGVPDDLDICSNSPDGQEVDETGCELIARTFVPDDRFEQRLIDLGLDDVLDDFVTTTNIDSLFDFELGGFEEANGPALDLTGLQDFISLETLFIGGFFIDELNLAILPQLTGFSGYGCDFVNFIAVNHPTLESINFFTDRVENLTITENDNFTSLGFSDNAIGTFILSGNNALRFFGGSDSGWNTATISDNPQLTGFEIDYGGGTNTTISNNDSLVQFGFGNSFYTNMVFLDNDSLTDISIFFDRGGLQSLDISGNPSITSLRLFGNDLNSLDISQNAALTTLQISDDPILSCIKVSQEQLDNIPPTWEIDPSMNYALDCP